MGKCDHQLARIQAVFGLAEEASLPPVGRETLRKFHEHLAARISVPFEALFAERRAPVRRLVHYVRVTGIMEVDDHLADGLLCSVQNLNGTDVLPLAEVGVREDDTNYQLIDDYAYWFINYR
jgi:hypothetical protein